MHYFGRVNSFPMISVPKIHDTYRVFRYNNPKSLDFYGHLRAVWNTQELQI